MVFHEVGIKNDEIRTAMILKKDKETTRVKADVKAGWIYNPGGVPGFLGKRRVGTETKTLAIYSGG